MSQAEWRDLSIPMSATNRPHDSLLSVCVCVCQCISSQRTEAHGRFLCVLAIKGEKNGKKKEKGGSITWREAGRGEGGG